MNQLYIAPDVVEDYDNGLEYGNAARVLRMVQRGDEREFLIQCVALSSRTMCRAVTKHPLHGRLSSDERCRNGGRVRLHGAANASSPSSVAFVGRAATCH